MSDPTTIKGLWWLPDKPEMQLAGDLAYGPSSGAQLNLLNHFFKDLTLEPFTVWGMTVRGKPVSLFDCHTKHLTTHSPGARVAQVSSYSGVIGGHFKTAEEMKFARVSADLSYLHEWTWTSGIKLVAAENEKRWQVVQEMLPNISLGTHGNFNLSLEFTSHLSPGFGNCKLSEICAFVVEAKELAPYKSFEEVVQLFQRFVALGVSRPVYALSISARMDKPRQMIQDQPIYDNFEIIRKLSVDDIEKKDLTPHDMQFCLADLRPAPFEFLKLFFDKHSLLEPVCDLYFSTLYQKEMFAHQRFLALAHAIEAYHRAFIGGKYLPNDKYQNGLQKLLWDAIPRDIAADFRASLKNKLKYLHEYSLRKRLQDICGKYNVILEPFLGDAAVFAGATADLRNWLTHPDSKAEDRPKEIDWGEIWLKGEQLGLVLEVCLLHEIGFSEQAIAKILPRNRRTRAIQFNK